MVAKLECQTATVLGPVDAQMAEAVRVAPWVHIDETTWRQANEKAWLWVGTGDRVTHHRISRHRDAQTARQILGDSPEKVAIRDRFSAYGWVKKKQCRRRVELRGLPAIGRVDPAGGALRVEPGRLVPEPQDSGDVPPPLGW